eukprot:1155125-Pelagomonas_calceolata.AAC.3
MVCIRRSAFIATAQAQDCTALHCTGLHCTQLHQFVKVASSTKCVPGKGKNVMTAHAKKAACSREGFLY